MPLVYAGAVSDINPAALTCVIAAGACIGAATPTAVATASIAAGSGWIKTNKMMRYGLLLCLMASVVLAIVGYPIAAILMNY